MLNTKNTVGNFLKLPKGKTALDFIEEYHDSYIGIASELVEEFSTTCKKTKQRSKGKTKITFDLVEGKTEVIKLKKIHNFFHLLTIYETSGIFKKKKYIYKRPKHSDGILYFEKD